MLMIMLILFYMVLSAAGIIVITILMIKAPAGWEDKDGFHFGKKSPASLNDTNKQYLREYFLKYYYMPITGNKVHLF